MKLIIIEVTRRDEQRQWKMTLEAISSRLDNNNTSLSPNISSPYYGGLIKSSFRRRMSSESDAATVYTSQSVQWLKDQNMSTNMSFRGTGYVLGKDGRKDSVVLPSWIESTFPWRVPKPESEGEGQG